MNKASLLTLSDSDQWNELVVQCRGYDVYHLAGYHRLAEEQHEGQAHLFVFNSNGKIALLPFLLRSIEGQPWLDNCKKFDATSVYGYAGPMCSFEGVDEAFRNDFQSALKSCLGKMGVITIFSRLHPLFESSWLLEGAGEISPLNQTVSVDLAQETSLILQQMRGSHRREILKAEKSGLVCIEDNNFSEIDKFIELYDETMKRVKASSYYFFPKEYYYNLKKFLGEKVSLYFIQDEQGQVMSASLFFFAGDVAQYHLSATPPAGMKYSAIKLLLYGVAKDAANKGFKHLHLGGGVGGVEEDSLFKFKAGFSPLRHQFSVLRWVLDEAATSKLELSRQLHADANAVVAEPSGFFPVYRAPL